MKLETLLFTLVFIISTINGGSGNLNSMDNSKGNFLRENFAQYLKSKRGTSSVPTGGQDLAEYEREMSSKDRWHAIAKQTTTRRSLQATNKPQQPQKEKSTKGKQKEEQDHAEGENHQQAEREKHQQTGKQHQVEHEKHRQTESEKHEQKIRKKEEKLEKTKESRGRMYNSTVNALSSIFANNGIASDIINIVRPTITRGIGNKISEKVNNVLGTPQQQQKQNEAVGTTWGEQKYTTAGIMVTEQTTAAATVGDNVESTGMEVESESATTIGTTTAEQAEIVGRQTEISGESNEDAGRQTGEEILNTETTTTIGAAINSDPIIQEPNYNEAITEGPSADNENVVKLEREESQSDAEKHGESETNVENIPKMEQDSTQVGTDIGS